MKNSSMNIFGTKKKRKLKLALIILLMTLFAELTNTEKFTDQLTYNTQRSPSIIPPSQKQ